MKNIVILGSTGSIGTNTLEVIRKFPNKFRVLGLSTNTSIEILINQVKDFKPKFVCVSDEECYKKIKDILTGTTVLSGRKGLIELATLEDAHIVVAAIVGFAGLEPTYHALKKGKTIALANKEVLVAAGHLFIKEMKEKSVPILPVDSEHSALFQCIQGQDRASITKLILTASGGPFCGMKKDTLSNVTASDALKHPNWSMGKKITIDSATLMNKGLEMIEAHHLFGLPPDNIEALIHRQSIVHSIVAFKDGSCLAQLSIPDMKGPIAYALSYPDRLDDIMKPLDLSKFGNLTFEKPDKDTFPCLSLAYESIKIGKSMPVVLNAANEVAVSSFLNSHISFNDIPVIIEKVMNIHEPFETNDIETILYYDKWARNKAMEVINS
ncbi:MAG: 1-deoxy-D-xylulose-5-phosphate reductoisomerase [Thermodesulfovibrionales bacterium]|nr:1-deoxy-D-xylulose-5-phosphate reductoisomerase [Thermodesulfovibrionales bacterium]